MNRMFSLVAIAFTITSLMLAPIAAQAKTRAGDGDTNYTQSSFAGSDFNGEVFGEGLLIGALEHDDDAGGAFPRYLLAILGGTLIFTAFFTIDGGTDQSGGT